MRVRGFVHSLVAFHILSFTHSRSHRRLLTVTTILTFAPSRPYPCSHAPSPSYHHPHPCQYPHEREVLLPPLSGLEAIGSSVEGKLLAIHSRLSLNLAAQTLEQVLSRRRKVRVLRRSSGRRGARISQSLPGFPTLHTQLPLPTLRC